MTKSEDVVINRTELEGMINSIGDKVNDYIESLKRKSANEILNGSLEEAQNIIVQILPIENEYKQMAESHNSFLKVLSGDQTTDFSTKMGINEKSELNKLDLSDMDFTPNDTYRVPILKALIYLGGSAKLLDVALFIEKDMKNKFKPGDHEKGANGFETLWIEMVNTEKENLVLEGLISEDTSNEKWEIVQNGIDFLSQNTN